MPLPPEKIIELAETGGFGTELKVAWILRAADWSVNQNVYYIDKDEKKGRELDISAWRGFQHIESQPAVTCGIQLCVEVKRTREPFIFFTDPPGRFETGGGYGLCRWTHNMDRFVMSYGDIEAVRPLRKPTRLGRTYSALKEGKAQQIQSGVLSAVKAAIHFKETCEERYSDGSRDIVFFMPIMVVDGELHECFLDEHGELTTQQVEEIVYRQNYLSEHYGSVSHHVYVMTLAAFEKRIAEFGVWGQHMADVMLANRDKLQADVED